MQKRQVEPQMSRHLHRIGEKRGLPISGNFELTARCNFNCPMCYVHLEKEDVEAIGRELTAKEWIDIAREAKEQGMIFALLTGGEPFVRKDFFEIYHAMKEMGILISINSNGSMINGEVLDKLKENPPFRINISLYGGCSETYKNMCGQDMFEQVVSNIRAIKEAGIDVRMNLSITPYNCEDVEKIYAISRELDVNVKASAYMYPPIRVNGEKYGVGNRLTPEESAKWELKADELRMPEEEYAYRIKAISRYEALGESECSMDLDEGVRCRAGNTSFWMTWDGKMLPCGMMPFPVAYPLDTGFSEAWEQTRKETSQIRIPVKCSNCQKRKVCGVCAAVCITESGAYDKVPAYMCQQTEAKIQKAYKLCQEERK